MKKINIKTMSLATITSLSLLLSGCTKETTKPSNEPPNIFHEEQIEYSTMTNNPEENPQNQMPNSTNPAYNEPQTTNAPNEFTYFADAKQKISEYLESEDYNSLKEKGKDYVTTGIDFIFYNEPINGVYFNDLTSDVKKSVLKDVELIDNAITSYYPDYKENISSKYQIASDFLSTKYYDILESIKNYLGDENYTAIGEIKKQIIGDITEKKDDAVDYIKNKYQDWSNKK